jgi:hypothetical protein
MSTKKLTREEFYSLPKNTLLLYDKDCLVLLLDNDYGEFYRRAKLFDHDDIMYIFYDDLIKKISFENIKYATFYTELFYGVEV